MDALSAGVKTICAELIQEGLARMQDRLEAIETQSIGQLRASLELVRADMGEIQSKQTRLDTDMQAISDQLKCSEQHLKGALAQVSERATRTESALALCLPSADHRAAIEDLKQHVRDSSRENHDCLTKKMTQMQGEALQQIDNYRIELQKALSAQRIETASYIDEKVATCQSVASKNRDISAARHKELEGQFQEQMKKVQQELAKRVQQQDVQAAVAHWTAGTIEHLDAEENITRQQIADAKTELAAHISDVSKEVEHMQEGVAKLEKVVDQSASLEHLHASREALECRLGNTMDQVEGLAKAVAQSTSHLDAVELGVSQQLGDMKGKVTSCVQELSRKAYLDQLDNLHSDVREQIGGVKGVVDNLQGTLERKVEGVSTALFQSTSHVDALELDIRQKIGDMKGEIAKCVQELGRKICPDQLDILRSDIREQIGKIKGLLDGDKGALERKVESAVAALSQSASRLDVLESDVQIQIGDMKGEVTKCVQELGRKAFLDQLDTLRSDIREQMRIMEEQVDCVEVALERKACVEKLDGLQSNLREQVRDVSEHLEGVATAVAQSAAHLDDLHDQVGDMKEELGQKAALHQLASFQAEVHDQMGKMQGQFAGIAGELERKACADQLDGLESELCKQVGDVSAQVISVNRTMACKVSIEQLDAVHCEIRKAVGDVAEQVADAARLVGSKASSEQVNVVQNQLSQQIEDMKQKVHGAMGHFGAEKTVQSTAFSERFADFQSDVHVQMGIFKTHIDDIIEVLKRKATVEQCDKLNLQTAEIKEQVDSLRSMGAAEHLEQVDAVRRAGAAEHLALSQQVGDMHLQITILTEALELKASAEKLGAVASGILDVHQEVVESKQLVQDVANCIDDKAPLEQVIALQSLLEQQAVQMKVHIDGTVAEVLGGRVTWQLADLRADIGQQLQELEQQVAVQTDAFGQLEESQKCCVGRVEEACLQYESFGQELAGAVTDVQGRLEELRIAVGQAASLQQLQEAITDLQQEAEERMLSTTLRRLSTTPTQSHPGGLTTPDDSGEVAMELKSVRDEMRDLRAQWLAFTRTVDAFENPHQRMSSVEDISSENSQLTDELMYTRKQFRRQNKAQGRTPLGAVENTLLVGRW